jgi:hypothetical protein
MCRTVCRERRALLLCAVLGSKAATTDAARRVPPTATTRPSSKSRSGASLSLASLTRHTHTHTHIARVTRPHRGSRTHTTHQTDTRLHNERDSLSLLLLLPFRAPPSFLSPPPARPLSPTRSREGGRARRLR